MADFLRKIGHLLFTPFFSKNHVPKFPLFISALQVFVAYQMPPFATCRWQEARNTNIHS